jgi:hypothetical protein
MRVLIVIAVLVGAAFMIVFVLMDLARELSRHSYHSLPDLDSSNDWGFAQDEFEGAVHPCSRTQNNGQSIGIASRERRVTISRGARTP